MQVIFMDGLDHAPDEIAAYRDHAMRTHPGAIAVLIDFDGDEAVLDYKMPRVPFERIRRSKNYDPANQCVACGAEMPEGDHVCKLCRDSTVYHHALNVRVTDAQMAAIERACIQKGLRIGEVVRGALDAWMKGQVAHQEDDLQEDDLQEDERYQRPGCRSFPGSRA